ncbi:P-loop containing nucleoside triphosphate hydrolase protein [Obba rivulosa]|uniref:P-loop containing nucleoside triphosphate hydrolase protein n=1 Tax=Obba rivulosa TaxID=1052685 RepID=A0A8E2DH45_9APHY|nr:P-loop containing nucleoside triphosphate hydrolase protein [Obba rivulosa]
MQLRTLIPSLPQALVDALDAQGIRTDADLLFSSSSTDIFKKLPTGTISLREFNELVAQVTERASAPAVRGDEVFTAETKIREDIIDEDFHTGLPKLDELLGGLSPPRVVEISGDRGSGKTTLALQLVLRHLSRVHDSSALWIDTTGDSLSPERVSTLLPLYEDEVRTRSSTKITTSYDPWAACQAVSSALERLQVAMAFDIEAAQEVLESMRESLSSDPTSALVIRCVVIDTITPLIGPLLSAVSSHGHAVMTTFMRELRSLANRFSLTILVINSSTGAAPRNRDSAFFATDRKPALGPSFTFLTDTTLWLTKHGTEGGDKTANTVVAEIFRSRKTRSRTWCTLKLRQGIMRSGGQS